MGFNSNSQLEHAGILERGLAWFLDGIVVFILSLVVLIPFFFIGDTTVVYR